MLPTVPRKLYVKDIYWGRFIRLFYYMRLLLRVVTALSVLAVYWCQNKTLTDTGSVPVSSWEMLSWEVLSWYISLWCETVVGVEEISNTYPVPQSVVYLITSDHREKVGDPTVCNVLDKSTLPFEQPVFSGEVLQVVWWYYAWFGDYYYLIKNGEAYEVYYSELDEMQQNPVTATMIYPTKQN